ncbi:MAG TPA: hypothetical protein P5055_04780 [Candidatus Paceibacterota bacterium]|nr:hypothetical protein [Candidatus Paceibacterota bacterium]
MWGLPSRFNPGCCAVHALVVLAGSIEIQALDVGDVLPVIRTLPAAVSITEGMRLTYHSTVATVPESAFSNWDILSDPDDYTRPSGQGYTQVDVVGITDQASALRVQAWQFYNYTGPVVPLFGSDACLVGYAGGGDWYVHPAALATIESMTGPGLTILRMPHQVGDRVFDAIRIQSEDDKSRLVTAYDLETGYLIFKSSALKGEKGITLTRLAFVGVRTLQFPWFGGSLPGWVTPGRKLRYDGYSTTTVIGSNPLVLPLTADVEILNPSDNWFLYQQTTTQGSLPGLPPTVDHRTLISGIHQLGGLCLPSAALKNLIEGQRIDFDETTGAMSEVLRVGTGANGRTSVTMKMTVGTVAWSEASYDVITGAATQLRTYDGPSPLYYTLTEVNLDELPPDIPALPSAPRLTIVHHPGDHTVTMSCLTEIGRLLTLLSSNDGCRTWTPVADCIDRRCDGQPFVYTIGSGTRSIFYRVQVR